MSTRYNSEFGLAADAHERAGDKAVKFGDWSGAAIYRFTETVYRLKHAICKGEEPKMTEAIFLVLEQVFAQLVEKTRDSAMEVQWGQGNGPMHMIQACVWLDQMSHPDWSKWVATALAAAEKLGQGFKPGADFVRAADLHKRGAEKAEAALSAVTGDINQVNEVKAAAWLILARRALATGQRQRAEELVAQMPETGAQHVCAAAQRLLAPTEA